ncbi:hypothetical protein [Duodenibacillus massiliensis]|uniref:hypothetical protein n=1 Tax=Duodenibacillus massiliensis TaxID=1852381 RepID=UPI0030790DFF
MFEREEVAVLRRRLAEPRRRIQIVSGPHGVGKTTAVQQATEGLQVSVLFASCPQDARRSPV